MQRIAKILKYRESVVLVVLVLFVLLLPQLTSASSHGSSFCSIAGSSLIKVPCPLATAPGPAGASTFGSLVLQFINISLLIVGSLAVLFLMVGGYRYVTSLGNEEAVEKAKKIIQNSILGLVIVVLSFVMIRVITRILITGTPF